MVRYEWIRERLNAEGDIEDVNHYETRKDAEFDREDGDEIGLTRDEGDEDRGLTDRLWAYVKDGLLPTHFSDSRGGVTEVKVPQRFLREARWEGK